MGSQVRLEYDGKEFDWTVLLASKPAELVEVYHAGLPRLTSDKTVGWQNKLVFGDNLSILRGLLDQPGIRGNVRLIYIDPPFSANQEWKGGRGRVATVSASDSDEIAYQDRLVGSEYLEFLRRRLILLRELLSSDGSIYVHIDWKMGHYVKVVMDEVFGHEHFVNDIARIKCNPKNFERKGYGNIRDMILFYSKSDDFVWNRANEPYSKEDIERLFSKIDRDGRRYATNPLHAPGETKNGVTGHDWKGLRPPRGRHWRYPPEELSRLDEAGLIEWSSRGNPRKKIYADEFEKKQKKAQDVWTFKDPAYPSYPTEKNLDMLRRIVSASSNPGDLVLDCFAGSAATLVAAEELGRRWIGMDNSPIAIRVAMQRLLKVSSPAPFLLMREASLALEPDWRKIRHS